MRQRESWLWNGEDSRATRRDVLIFRDDTVWQVELREGGEDGWARVITAADSVDAHRIASHLAPSAAHWQKLA